MSSSAARDTASKKKQVRFASMEADDDNDDQEEDTLFDKRKDAARALKSVLKAAKRTTKPGCDDRVEVVGGRRGAHGACWRWAVTLAVCGSFLGLVRETPPRVREVPRALSSFTAILDIAHYRRLAN